MTSNAPKIQELSTLRRLVEIDGELSKLRQLDKRRYEQIGRLKSLIDELTEMKIPGRSAPV